MNPNFTCSSQRSDSRNVGAQFPPEGSDAGDVRRGPTPLQGELHSARPLNSAIFMQADVFPFAVTCGCGEHLMCQKMNLSSPHCEEGKLCCREKIPPCCVSQCGCLCFSGRFWKPSISGFHSLWIHCAARKQEGPLPQMVRAQNLSDWRSDTNLMWLLTISSLYCFLECKNCPKKKKRCRPRLSEQ